MQYHKYIAEESKKALKDKEKEKASSRGRGRPSHASKRGKVRHYMPYDTYMTYDTY
jgi:hypothetical protein